jgi:hypothetical protein
MLVLVSAVSGCGGGIDERRAEKPAPAARNTFEIMQACAPDVRATRVLWATNIGIGGRGSCDLARALAKAVTPMNASRALDGFSCARTTWGRGGFRCTRPGTVVSWALMPADEYSVAPRGSAAGP